MMIIDTFPFNRDFNALEIRFEELKNTVDLFIASEASYSHSGLPKELHLSNAKSIRKAMGNQLIVIASIAKPLTRNPRTREMLQRQRITRVIKRLNLHSSDLILHSDCDEIPRATILEKLKKQMEPVDAILELDNYANYINTKDGSWPRCRIQSYSNFRTIQDMRADIFIQKASFERRHILPLMRLTDFWSKRRFPFNSLPEFVKVKNLEVIPGAGWHFNNLFEADDILRKIESSSHVEWNTLDVRLNALSNYRNGCDIYTGQKHEVVAVDDSFPRCITSNLSRWATYIFE
jgi:hypothetical protein